MAVLWAEVLEFVGSKVCGWKCKIRDCTQICPSEQVFVEMETRSEFLVAPKEVAHGHCEVYNVTGFSLQLERMDDGESPREKIAGWSARMVANVIGVQKPPWMEMDQWWRLCTGLVTAGSRNAT